MRWLILPILTLSFLLSSCGLIDFNGGLASSPTPLPPFIPPALETAPVEDTPAPEGTGDLSTPDLPPTEAASETPIQTPTASSTPEPVATATTSPTTTPSSAADFPDPQAYQWVNIAGGLNRPVGFENAGDGSGRLFVLEQAGVIQVLSGNEILPTPFLDIRDRVGSEASEQGLLGLAFHPRYIENGYFFVNYTDRSGDTIIARFRVSGDPNRADPTTEARLLYIPQPYRNHNGGVTAFGPDGYLYLGLGDGGSGGDPLGYGQSLDTLLGKILRIDVDPGLDSGAEELYVIPPDNPFATGGGLPEIWAYGLRNPWRFSFDDLTGDLYIADVGQNSYEEVNFQPADSAGGENYGWNILEGFECFRQQGCDTSQLTLPVHVYETRSNGNCSITGGYVYRGSLPDWQGVYFFGDYCSGRVWGLLPSAAGEWQSRLLFETGATITTFGLDEAGELYIVSHNGSISRLEPRP
jgi:glucose/arabinose dehydrogenase